MTSEDSGTGAGHLVPNIPHAVQLMTALGVVLAAIKLVMVSGASPQIAAAVLRSSGYVDVAFALLLFTLPAVMVTVPLYVYIRYAMANLEDIRTWRSETEGSDILVLSLVGAVGMIFAMAIFAEPWLKWGYAVLLFLTIMLGGFVRSIARHGRRGRIRRKARRWFGALVTVFLGALLMATVASPTMWMPAELLTFDDGGTQETMVGYYLGESSGWVHVLKEENRMLEHRPLSTLASREVCRLTDGPVTIPRATIEGMFFGDIPEQPEMCF